MECANAIKLHRNFGEPALLLRGWSNTAEAYAWRLLSSVPPGSAKRNYR
jgi:hypothetical protein